MNWTGVLISWAMPAASCPTARIFSARRSSSSKRLRSSNSRSRRSLRWTSSSEARCSERSSCLRSSSAARYASLTAASNSANASCACAPGRVLRSCLRSNGCISTFRECRDRHRLVVQLAAGAGRERRDLAVRIETRQARSRAEHVADCFHFFLDPLAEHQLAADAADEYRQLRRTLSEALLGGSRRA